jgi:cytochrome c oxidase subunit 2
MRILVLLLIACSFSHVSFSEPMEPIPKALEPCSVCHGTQLMGNPNTGAPRLTGLPGWYISNQITAFKKGWRGSHPDDHSGAEMVPMAKSITADMLKMAIKFANTASSPIPQPTLHGDVSRGKKLYSQCAACHGENAQGNKALSAPPLISLNDWYILKQLKHFKEGIRGQAAGYTNGNMMAVSVQNLPDEAAMTDLATYITHIKTEKEN